MTVAVEEGYNSSNQDARPHLRLSSMESLHRIKENDDRAIAPRLRAVLLPSVP